MEIEAAFRPLLGAPCWDVHWDSQTNLRLNFGAPHLVVREPIPGSPLITRRYRAVWAEGDWRLWVFSAHWQLSGLQDMEPVRSSASPKRIGMGLARLDGQALTAISARPDTAATRLQFDLGAVLEVRRLDRGDDAEVWTLYSPDRKALSVRGVGEYRFGDVDAAGIPWRRLAGVGEPNKRIEQNAKK